jgi:hypothetical protein
MLVHDVGLEKALAAGALDFIGEFFVRGVQSHAEGSGANVVREEVLEIFDVSDPVGGAALLALFEMECGARVVGNELIADELVLVVLAGGEREDYVGLAGGEPIVSWTTSLSAWTTGGQSVLQLFEKCRLCDNAVRTDAS